MKTNQAGIKKTRSNKMKNEILTRDDILKKQDIESISVEVPEWGGKVLIKAMTTKQFEEMVQEAQSRAGKDGAFDFNGFRASLVAQSLVDKEGNLLFTQDDIEALGGKSNKVIQNLFAKIQEINGLTDEGIEDIAKNSGVTPS